MELDLAKVAFKGDAADKKDAVLLFSESASRLLVTVRPEKAEAFEKALAGTTFAKIGAVTEAKNVSVKGLSGKVVVNSAISELKAAWQEPLKDL
jgi:phosphoribosylformylglycinamidine synthase